MDTRALSLSGTVLVVPLLVIVGCSSPTPSQPEDSIRWLAGDHHIHSRYSVEWNESVNPAVPIIGGHADYPIPLNALMAKYYGLSWMVATDHGGRYHSKVNLEQAYPNLLVARDAVPEIVQFFGVELNAPGADHTSVIVPHTHDEVDRVYELESRFDRSTAGGSRTNDPGADSVERMLEALEVMKGYAEKPIVITNHPSRTATGGAWYGRTTPAELRAWNDSAPEIAIGMAGAPGHQASSINPDGSVKPVGVRGEGYNERPTLGGFDPMTARLGGFWDSMLGEGRRWWITANSDSHRHWTDGGPDFWPGEYSKTYVYADKQPGEILTALRAGRVFVTTGDLISELNVTVSAGGGALAGIGGELTSERGAGVLVTIRARDPENENAHGDLPTVSRIDLIIGEIAGRSADVDRDSNSSTYVARRFEERDWTREGELLTMSHRIDGVDGSFYVRVRGTSTDELEPEPDPPGEDPWADLWFYSNPVFVRYE